MVPRICCILKESRKLQTKNEKCLSERLYITEEGKRLRDQDRQLATEVR